MVTFNEKLSFIAHLSQEATSNRQKLRLGPHLRMGP